MPTTLKFLLYLTAASVFLLACMFFVEKPAAQQHEAHQQIQGWVMESMVELEKAAAKPGSESRSPEYEACARAVRDDYNDDAVKAYWWVRTVCHR